MQRNVYKTVAGMAIVALMGLGLAACSEDTTTPDTNTPPAPELPVVTEGLVAYVALDGRVIESTGKVDSNAITKVGMTPTSDRNGAAGKAMYFDGVDDYASLPGLDTIQIWPFTWSMWVRVDGAQSNGLIAPVGKYLHPNGDGTLIFWENNLFASLYTVNNFANYCRIDLDDGLAPDTWHHVVVTMDHIDGMIMYVDNVRADFAGWVGQVAKSRTSEPLRFGIINSVHPTEKPVPFKGSISDFAVYNRVLTEAERTQLYTSTK
jgi:hypothetical protein